LTRPKRFDRSVNNIDSLSGRSFFKHEGEPSLSAEPFAAEASWLL
jgi:hypothetical protein